MADKAAQDMQAMKLRDRSEESAREEVSHPPKIVVVTANPTPARNTIIPPAPAPLPLPRFLPRRPLTPIDSPPFIARFTRLST